MHTLLTKLLEKRNIKTTKELEVEEKADFDRWDSILQRPDISKEDVEALCEFEIGEMEKELSNLSNTHRKNERLVILLTVWRKIQRLMEGNRAEREALEEYIQKLLDNE